MYTSTAHSALSRRVIPTKVRCFSRSRDMVTGRFLFPHTNRWSPRLRWSCRLLERERMRDPDRKDLDLFHVSATRNFGNEVDALSVDSAEVGRFAARHTTLALTGLSGGMVGFSS